ncbi:DUF559 domain-containing protein [Pseudonocardia nigra]|uniref:DUF559 domain-containing protein n=1 Tax=Pseudonocardia nigra TaxID=1921578 RepID=UPI001C6070BE|nr:DUF559 domain-containing protein [Pseudonocardia nigra]
MDLTGPFRGSTALAAGALTRGVLAGPRFRRIYPDVYVPAGLVVDLALLSRAAAVLVEPDGVLSGYSAAELLNASCGPKDAPAEVTVPAFRRAVPDLLVHRGRVPSDDVVHVDGVPVTSPARTAFDLARWLSLTEGVVAVDALARRHPFIPADLRALRSVHLGAWGCGRLEAVLRLADPRAASPMETRIRVALVLAGMPPCVQHPVATGGREFRLDLAYPAVMLAVEYDGRHHLDPGQALYDLEREALLTAAGWKVIRFRAGTVLHRPQLIVARTRAELQRRRS